MPWFIGMSRTRSSSRQRAAIQDTSGPLLTTNNEKMIGGLPAC